MKRLWNSEANFEFQPRVKEPEQRPRQKSLSLSASFSVFRKAKPRPITFRGMHACRRFNPIDVSSLQALQNLASTSSNHGIISIHLIQPSIPLLTSQTPQTPNLSLLAPLHTTPTTHLLPMLQRPHPFIHHGILQTKPFTYPYTNKAGPPTTALTIRISIQMPQLSRLAVTDVAGPEIDLLYLSLFRTGFHFLEYVLSRVTPTVRPRLFILQSRRLEFSFSRGDELVVEVCGLVVGFVWTVGVVSFA